MSQSGSGTAFIRDLVIKLFKQKVEINDLNFENNEGVIFSTLMQGNKKYLLVVIEYSGCLVEIPANKDYRLDYGI